MTLNHAPTPFVEADGVGFAELSRQRGAMSPATVPAPDAGPLLIVPGMMPDAISYAFRFTLALLLAYWISFAIQLSSAATAGISVAIVMQPSPGMALMKAFYRVVGTLIGGMTALAIVSAFPQDRTMLLVAFVLWLGACIFVGSLLRDFRAYGAVLAGYTVATIDISGIGDPSGALLATLNRVAAILIGIGCVAAVNTVLSANTAHATVLADLRRQFADMRDIALGALCGAAVPDDVACARRAAAIVALRTEATYGAAELPDGRRREAAMSSVIAALLAMLAASRALRRTLPLAGPHGPSPVTRAYLDAASLAIREDVPIGAPKQLPLEPLDALLIERAGALAAETRKAHAGLRALVTDVLDNSLLPVTFGVHNDYFGALLNAVRGLVAIGLGSVFCIYGGYAGTTQLLVLQAAATALLSLQPRPSAAAKNFLLALVFAAPAAGLIDYLLLPLASGFVTFALAVGGPVFLLVVATRHARTAPFGPPLYLLLTALLAPSNVQSFDLTGFLNGVLTAGIGLSFVMVTFRLVLPVSPSRRLFRLTDAARRSLRRTLRHRRDVDQSTQHARNADRLSQALLWIGSPYPARRALLSRIYDFSDLDVALSRAWRGMRESCLATQDLTPAARIGRDGLASARPESLELAARALLAHPQASLSPDGVLRAASGLYGAKLLLDRQSRALSHYGVLER